MNLEEKNKSEVPKETKEKIPSNIIVNNDDIVIEETNVQPYNFWMYILVSIGNFFLKLGKWIISIILHILRSLLNIFIYAYKGIVALGKKIYKVVRDYIMWFIDGSYKTRLSYLFCGVGHYFRGRPIKATLYLLLEGLFIMFMALPRGGGYWLSKFGNLGDKPFEIIMVEEIDPFGNVTIVPKKVFLDNSMLIMLYSVLTIMIIVGFAFMYFKQIKGQHLADLREREAKEEYNANLANYNEQVSELALSAGLVAPVKEENETLEAYNERLAHYEAQTNDLVEASELEKPVYTNPHPTAKEEANSMVNENFHYTTLMLPSITILIFTILPLVFMILLAFTNYSGTQGPPNQLFTWTGFSTFNKLFNDKVDGFAVALGSIFEWTIIWALFATFSNYILGMILAIMINKKGIKLKKMWRTIFVISIAVPQFVTLLLMSKMLAEYGPFNELLLKWGWINKRINFLGKKTSARITIIIVNMWVGVPYTMLITSGILMNIPADLYESARIDGANAFTQFMKITLPYMLFVTGPYLITNFIGNINNFNVIFFLTGGGPSNTVYPGLYGETDILVTWLYKLTIGGAQQEYAMGSALGILIFLISVFITLMLYSRTSAATAEGDFA